MSYHNEIVQGLSDAIYHESSALSSTGARLLLPEYKGSPKKFHHAQTNRRTSRTFDFGHAVHAKVLGAGLGIVTYPLEHLTPSGNPSTKAATVEWEAEQRAAGFTVVSPDDAGRVEAMSEAVLAHETARPIFEVAHMREVSVFGDVDGVSCRARFDALSDETKNGVYAVDLKSDVDATKGGFERSVAKWGYEVQDAHYEAVYEAATGRPVDKFFFVVAEKTAPYEVAVFQLPEVWVQMGRAKAAKARQIFQECTNSGVWPGYSTEIQFLDPPTWLVFDHETNYEYGEIQI